jgi:hypothetical protein
MHFSPALSAVNLRPARVPEGRVQTLSQPNRDRTVRIAALRVEFVEDTLSTTTGTGKFDYTANDTMYFDPPPHDADYFTDQLTFLRYYWKEMSSGALDIDWQVFPAGAQAAYHCPSRCGNIITTHPRNSLITDWRGCSGMLFRQRIPLRTAARRLV